MLKCPTLQQKKKHVYSLVQKMILVYIANFTLLDNCEGGAFFFITRPLKLYQALKFCIIKGVTTIDILCLAGVVSATMLHPHPAFLPIFDYRGVTRNQDGDGRRRALWASKMLFRNLRVTSRTLRPFFFTVYGYNTWITVMDCVRLSQERQWINFPKCLHYRSNV